MTDTLPTARQLRKQAQFLLEGRSGLTAAQKLGSMKKAVELLGQAIVQLEAEAAVEAMFPAEGPVAADPVDLLAEATKQNLADAGAPVDSITFVSEGQPFADGHLPEDEIAAANGGYVEGPDTDGDEDLD